MKPELPNKAAAGDEGGEAALTLKLPRDVVAAVDTYAADAAGHPNRNALVLRIIRDWLVTNGYLRSDPIGDIDGGVGDSTAD